VKEEQSEVWKQQLTEAVEEEWEKLVNEELRGELKWTWGPDWA
jgi:hypothetical protein